MGSETLNLINTVATASARVGLAPCFFCFFPILCTKVCTHLFVTAQDQATDGNVADLHA